MKPHITLQLKFGLLGLIIGLLYIGSLIFLRIKTEKRRFLFIHQILKINSPLKIGVDATGGIGDNSIKLNQLKDEIK